MARHTIYLAQGSDTTITATWEIAGVPVDVTGYTASMQVRDSVLSETVAATPSLVLGGVAGTVAISFTNVQTSALLAGTEYFYDLELTSAGGGVTRILGGSLFVTGEVSR